MCQFATDSGCHRGFVAAKAVMVGIGFMMVHTLTLTNFRNHVAARIGVRRTKLPMRIVLLCDKKIPEPPPRRDSGGGIQIQRTRQTTLPSTWLDVFLVVIFKEDRPSARGHHPPPKLCRPLKKNTNDPRRSAFVRTTSLLGIPAVMEGRLTTNWYTTRNK